MARILDLGRNVDRAFAVSDQVAIGIVLACQARGIKLPDAMGTVGCADVDLPSHLAPSLIAIRVPE